MSTLHLAPHAGNVAVARRFVRETLEDRGCPEDVVDAAVLCTSELVTNVVLHARTAATVGVRFTGPGVRVEVTDRSPGRPTQPSPPTFDDPTGAAGRGLRLVGAFATRHGVEPAAEGKTVWFEIDPGVDPGVR